MPSEQVSFQNVPCSHSIINSVPVQGPGAFVQKVRIVSGTFFSLED